MSMNDASKIDDYVITTSDMYHVKATQLKIKSKDGVSEDIDEDHRV